jgi:zinc protease
MNVRILVTLAACLMLAPPLSADEAVSRGSRTIARLAAAPLNWKLPVEGQEFQVLRSRSGVTFYCRSDRTVPLLSVRGIIRAGAVFESGYPPQVARVTARMLRECGSENMTVEKLDSLLNFYAGNLDILSGPDLVSVQATMTSSQSDTLVEILAGLLARPAFTQERFDYVIQRIRTEEETAAEDPFYLCGRKFQQLLYTTHPYGYLHSADGIDRVTLAEVERYFRNFYGPANIALIVTGDFDAKRVLKKWEAHYEGHPASREVPTPDVPEPQERPGVFLLHKNINQSSIYFGCQSVARDLTDIHRIHLLNHMVGGSSFASRFTQQVRDREGLAYRVDSLFDTDVLGRATFVARCRTKTDTTVRALDAMLWIIGLFRDGRIGATEFEAGVAGLRNGFVKRFATTEDVLANFLMLSILGRPRSYLEEYQTRAGGITPAQLQETARNYLDPARMTYVVVGDVRQIEADLKKFGTIYHLSDSTSADRAERPQPPSR